MPRYLTRVFLAYPTDPKEIERIENENPPLNKRKMKHVASGVIVDDIPEDSVEWLLRQGQIEPVPPVSRRVNDKA